VSAESNLYQPAPGVWASSPQRKVLWALHGVIHKLTKADPEQPLIDDWQEKLSVALYSPVEDYDWEAWYTRNVSVKSAHAPRWKRVAVNGFMRLVKDDRPDVPDDVLRLWLAIPQSIRDELWKQAAQVRMGEEGLPYLEDEIRAGLDETFHEVKGITDTARNALRNMLKLAYDEREGHVEFGRMIRREFKQWSAAKAQQIAVTEWARAAETAQLYAYTKNGVQTKIWYSLGDDRVCDQCENNAAEGEIPLGQAFSSGDQIPPAHPACRCSFAGGM
jgi:SPP1 gp7 family putative phage head morphogenesis protein